MADMYIKSLDNQHMKYALRTLSPYAFFYIVGDAILNKKPLSTVRMGDGEVSLLKACLDKRGEPEYFTNFINTYDDDKLKRMGIYGIKYAQLDRRLRIAGNECTHFAPSVSGLTQDGYNLYDWFSTRQQYVDNFFVNIWDSQMQAELYKAAGKVLFIHRNVETADAMQANLKKHLGVAVQFLRLSTWEQSDNIIDQAQNSQAPLVLFAGGPASKYISPEIAKVGKVVLDLGNATDLWTLSNYKP
jgi:hypothetical protein